MTKKKLYTDRNGAWLLKNGKSAWATKTDTPKEGDYVVSARREDVRLLKVSDDGCELYDVRRGYVTGDIV